MDVVTKNCLDGGKGSSLHSTTASAPAWYAGYLSSILSGGSMFKLDGHLDHLIVWTDKESLPFGTPLWFSFSLLSRSAFVRVHNQNPKHMPRWWCPAYELPDTKSWS